MQYAVTRDPVLSAQTVSAIRKLAVAAARRGAPRTPDLRGVLVLQTNPRWHGTCDDLAPVAAATWCSIYDKTVARADG